jgi:DNA-binding NtrC family response regulator
VGTDTDHPVDVRFVAATNRDLAAAVSAGRFRADLLYRLQRWVIRVPSLRERKEDIPALVAHAVARGGGPPRPCGYSLMLRLLCHAWPGNVRELEAVVERLVVEQPGAGSLDLPDWLPEVLGPSSGDTRAEEIPPEASRAARPTCPEPDELRRLLVDSGGNVRALAEALGVSRNSLYRWLRAAGVDPDSTRG